MYTRPRRLLFLTSSLALAVALGACGSSAATDAPDPAPTTDGSTAPSTDSTPTSATTDVPSAAAQITQTDTSWGRLWDDLPSGFPIPPEATIADDATAEPVSGVFAIPGGDPAQIATWMQAALETATYSTEALSGPLEDGSMVLDSTGEGDCRIQTVVAPAGGLTLLLVRYGAACPNG
jgi:hypothetical protein